jgi:aryl-alcohol dehydrogenase-like predicted oxidoreductase
LTFATPPDPPGHAGRLGHLEQLGLGASNLHVKGLDVAFEVLDAWVAAGGRLIDTAASYGAGESERAIGAWLRARGTRDRVVLLTKGGHPDPSYRQNRVTPEILESDLAGSLLRLGVPSVDILLVHRDDPGIPVGAIIETLAAQVGAGRARAYGVSNWTLPRLDEALAYVDAHGLPPLAWSSSYLGLATPLGPAWPGVVDATDDASRAWYAAHPTRLEAWSPVANGFFSSHADLSAERFDAYRTPANLARRERAAVLGARRGVTASQIALAWVLCQPFAPVAPIGTSSTAHLAEAIEAASIYLTDVELRWLEHGDDMSDGANPTTTREEAAWTS